MAKESKRYTLNKEDLKKIGRGAFMAIGGALVVFLLDLLPNLDLGEYTPVLIPVVSIALNSADKFFRGK